MKANKKRTLKVWHYNWGRFEEIVATKTKAEAIRAFDTTRSEFNKWGEESENVDGNELALSNPGTIFRRQYLTPNGCFNPEGFKPVEQSTVIYNAEAEAIGGNRHEK